MSLDQYNEISRLLLAYSSGDYSEKGSVSSKVNDLDMIISGINMLGEELELANVSRDFFLSIFNTVADLVFVVDKDGIILDVNKAVETTLADQKDELISAPIQEFLLNDLLFEKITWELSNDTNICSFESLLVKEGKRVLTGSFTATKLFNRADVFNGYLLAVKDITKQKQNEQMILQTIISTQQKEQKRVADDLHDSLGQELSMAKLMISNLSKFGGDNAEFKSLLDTTKNMLDNSIDHLREVCFDLMPNVLIHGGLSMAIKDLLDRLDNLDKIDVEVHIDNAFPRLARDLEIVVYRLVQEFINNMIKHSDATNLFVNLYEHTNDSFIIDLRENGQGFDVSKLDKPKENRGYSNMKSNVKAFDGEFTLQSSKKEGTLLKVKFPKLYEE